MNKTCLQCKISQPITEFYVNRKSRILTCRTCISEKYNQLESGLEDKKYTSIPQITCKSYADHVALKIAKGELDYVIARQELKFTPQGRKTWNQVISYLRTWK